MHGQGLHHLLCPRISILRPPETVGKEEGLWGALGAPFISSRGLALLRDLGRGLMTLQGAGEIHACQGPAQGGPPRAKGAPLPPDVRGPPR